MQLSVKQIELVNELLEDDFSKEIRSALVDAHHKGKFSVSKLKALLQQLKIMASYEVVEGVSARRVFFKMLREDYL